MGHGLELVESGDHVVAGEADEGALVAHLVAVVGRTEHSDALACARRNRCVETVVRKKT